MSKPKAITIVGPTASGKTSLSIEIATHFNGEVISADSRQVYRGMDIGTGKVTPEEMGTIPHHLLDIRDPMDVYTGADFKKDAETAMRDITVRGKLPIIAGGTQFYVELLKGTMTPAPVSPNPTLRAKLESRSTSELFADLHQRDQKRAASIDPENRRRLIRALEIIDTLGYVPEPSVSESPYEWLTIGVDISKEQLHQNIHIRLHERLTAGMIEEAQRLHAEGVTYARMDELGLEYRYLAKYLQKELTLEAMTETLEAKIRQYAKRQMTWLKRDEEIVWVKPTETNAILEHVDTFLLSDT